ncbi:MAG: hypothetical protein JWO85_2111 [Candidatus Eremiobacteraeota bacterium]|nr:hypothetical protein [Candidatus Eremiobacteraeota bacterium]
MRTVLLAALFALLATGAAPAQAPQQLHANAVIPVPPPTAPIADWTNAKGRTTTTLEVNGATLRGWSYAGTDPKAPTVVFFNKNGTTIDKNDALYRAIAALGPRVVTYDYRGYGFSFGIPGVHLMQEDAVRIVETVAKDAGPRGVVVYGFSLGTAVAAYAASQTTVAGVILAAPLASAQEEMPVALLGSGVSANVAANVTPAPDAVAAFAVTDFVGRFQAPLLVLHGTADTDVPIAQGREVYASSTSPRKLFVEAPGLTHDQIVNAPDSRAAVKAFVATLTR